MTRPTQIAPWILAGLLLLGGCSLSGGSSANQLPAAVEHALATAESFELYSLDPDPQGEEEESAQKPPEGEKDKPQMKYAWTVLGHTAISNKDERTSLVAALKKGITENTGMAAACFNPRHAIRVEHDGKKYDVVICFECLSAAVYTNGERSGRFRLTKSPQPTFDAVLTKAGVKLPKAGH